MARSDHRTRNRLFVTASVLAIAIVVFGAMPAWAICSGGDQGQPMIIGCANEGGETFLQNLDGPGLTVFGNSGYGIKGSADNGGWGVYGIAFGNGGNGVVGDGWYAVHGYSAQNWGVWGEGADRGVYGISANEGVVGVGSNVGVRAESSKTALKVVGKATFSRSGKTTIAAGLTKKDVSMTGLTSSTIVTATLQGAPITGLWVQTVQVVSASNKFTIYLNKAVPSGKTATIGYFVVN